MAGIRFTEEQQYILSQNKNMKKVTTKSIPYADEFKVNAVKKMLKGKFRVTFLKNQIST